MKNKTYLIAFLFLFAFILMISSNVQAMTFTYNEVEHTVPDLPEDSANFNSQYYSILKNGDGYLLLSYIGYNNETMYICNTNESTGRMGIMSSDGGMTSARIKRWSINQDVWTLDSWQCNTSMYAYYNRKENADKFIYSTVKIFYATYVDDTHIVPQLDQEVFFQPPLEGVPLVIPVEVAEIPEMIQRIVTILIRVGLIIFGTLYVALVLSSRILRKT